MAKKKKKTRKKEKRRFPKVIAALSALILAAVAGGLWAVKDFKLTESGRSAPVYEEIHAAGQRLDQWTKGVDRAIYESFYRQGIREEDIHFRKVQSRRRQGYRWEYAEMLVTCRHRADIAELERHLDRALRDLAPSIRFEKRETGQGQLDYLIIAMGLETHRLILSVGKRGRPAVKRPRVAIIIDDLGHDPKLASSLMNLGLPLTLAVLPYAPFSKRIAREAQAKGFELLLHLPMEPKNYPEVDPGRGALFLNMENAELHAALKAALDEIPGVQGVNNHMGSMFTENRAKMAVFMEDLKRRNLFFVDSRTTSKTVGYETARTLGVPAASRNVFLDNDLECGAIRVQIDRLKGLARHSGKAVAIAHPFRETLKALKENARSLSSDVELVAVSNVLS